MILIIDNYDSFTFNLVHYFEQLTDKVVVKRNDKITLEDIDKLKPQAIVISPGPCTFREAGISTKIVEKYKGVYPILGICLGMQVISAYFGANVVKASKPVHGHISRIYHTNNGIFKNINNPTKVTRYHSLIVENDTFPSCLEITAQTNEKEIMGIRHKQYFIEGVQFHPEAVLTEDGMQMLKNFIEEVKSAS